MKTIRVVIEETVVHEFEFSEEELTPEQLEQAATLDAAENQSSGDIEAFLDSVRPFWRHDAVSDSYINDGYLELEDAPR